MRSRSVPQNTRFWQFLARDDKHKLSFDKDIKLRGKAQEKVGGEKLKDTLTELRGYGDSFDDLNNFEGDADLDNVSDWSDAEIEKYLPKFLHKQKAFWNQV